MGSGECGGFCFRMVKYEVRLLLQKILPGTHLGRKTAAAALYSQAAEL